MEDALLRRLLDRRDIMWGEEDDVCRCDDHVSRAVVPDKDGLAAGCSLDERGEHLVKPPLTDCPLSQAFLTEGWNRRLANSAENDQFR